MDFESITLEECVSANEKGAEFVIQDGVVVGATCYTPKLRIGESMKGGVGMVKCVLCGCSCDPSDLTNGICYDCMEQLADSRRRIEEIGKMVVPSNSGQMEILGAGGAACAIE